MSYNLFSAGFYASITESIDWENAIQQITQSCFGLICHQDPSILMNIGDKVFQLCPRCVGLHFGFFFCFIALAMQTRQRIRFADKRTRLALAVPIGVILAHWFLGRFDVLAPDSLSRLVTGLLCGSVLSFVVVAYRRDLINRSVAAANVGFLHIVALMFLSFSVGLALVVFAGWTTLSTIILGSTLANALIATHTAFILMRARLFSQSNNNQKQ